MSRCFGELARVAAGLATGRLGWTPEAFWAATPADLALALAGLLPGSSAGAAEPLSRAEMLRMMERIDHDG